MRETGGVARKVKYWTVERVIQEIRTLDDLSAKYNQRVNSSLYGAAVRYFSGWGKAVTAAGFDYDAVARRRLPGYWDKEKLLHEIRSLGEMNSGSVRKARTDVYSAALRVFGTWQEAIESAGIKYNSIRRDWVPEDELGLRFHRNACVSF